MSESEPDIRLHRAINTDEYLVVLPDFRGELVVVVAREREMKSFTKFRNAVLERTWQPRVIGREQWRRVRARL
jgi:hypothetical protein